MEEKTPGRNFDYEAVMQKFKEQFRSGKSLFGKDGVFGPMLQDFLNAAFFITTSPSGYVHSRDVVCIDCLFATSPLALC